jgi:hypothetical protein
MIKKLKIPKDIEEKIAGLTPEEQLDVLEAEIKALDGEYIAQVKELKKIGDKTKTKKEFLDKAIKVLIKRTATFFAHKDDPTFTFNLFKQYYEAVGMKFEEKDVERVRTNMLLLGQKLYEIHMQRTKEMEQKNE